ncbi:hypothetical protein SEVIR_1G061701v4 [Setaria viridis]
MSYVQALMMVVSACPWLLPVPLLVPLKKTLPSTVPYAQEQMWLTGRFTFHGNSWSKPDFWLQFI